MVAERGARDRQRQRDESDTGGEVAAGGGNGATRGDDGREPGEAARGETMGSGRGHAAALAAAGRKRIVIASPGWFSISWASR